MSQVVAASAARGKVVGVVAAAVPRLEHVVALGRGLPAVHAAPLGGWGLGTVPALRARLCDDFVPIV